MIILERKEKYKVNTEEAAKEAMEQLRADAAKNGYSIKQCGYTFKTKKGKEEPLEAYIVSVTKEYANVWEV